MTDKNYTHIALVVDRSGSMRPIKNDMIGAINTFFEEQSKLDGKALVDYAQFDDSYEVVYTDTDISNAKASLEPRGMTALTDAFGKTIATLGEKLAKLEEDDRPGKVIVVVVTDGGENASEEWTAEQVKKAVKEQTEKYGWEFVFLGANIDAVATGAGYGLSRGQTITYDVHNTQAALASTSAYVGATRSGKSASFTDDDRKAAVGG